MQVDYLIVGQGICGSFLSWYLQKEGKSFVVIDEMDTMAPSRVAAGIINPVTGRRMVRVWMAEKILSFAHDAYNQLGHELGIEAIHQKNIIDFFPNPHQRQVFLERIAEGEAYLASYAEQNQFNPFFRYDFGCGEIRHCYLANLEIILPAWRDQLKQSGRLLEHHFDMDQLVIGPDSVRYNQFIAEKIFFCDGSRSTDNRFFRQLPFAPNKGEALTVEIPGLPGDFIYKKGFLLAPLQSKDLFWFGSNYQWSFSDANPTREFYEQAKNHLSSWVKTPFTILDHRASVRPATIERRPFVGLHPHEKNIGILNGMGTKGCSLAPFFASQLVNNVLYDEPIEPLADIKRFQRILSL